MGNTTTIKSIIKFKSSRKRLLDTRRYRLLSDPRNVEADGKVGMRRG